MRPTSSSSRSPAGGPPAGTSTARGASRPAAATAHSNASHVTVARQTWTQTISLGSFSSYWTLPTSPWAARSTPSTVSGSSSCAEAPRRRCRNQTPITATPKIAAIVACW